MFSIMVVSSEVPEWHNLGEGPWDNAQQAIRFADTEVGVPWLVVASTRSVVAYGDATGIHWTAVDAVTCPGCQGHRCDLNGDRWFCNDCDAEF